MMTEKSYYFIGIGGIGMSGLAKILIERGFKVSGSDLVTNKQTDKLVSQGATINIGQNTANISSDIDIVVVTSAIKDDNPELIEAKRHGLNIISRSKLLNEIITEHKAIAVTGTHGKTTTSSMLALALDEAGLDPTAVIGAEVHNINGNAKLGKGEYSVAEVCEYERAFLDVYPFGAIITNIEADHLDCYKDLDDIVDAFMEFVTHIPKDGFLLYQGEDSNCQKVSDSFVGRKFSYGFDETNDYSARDVNVPDHFTTFTVYKNDKLITECSLNIPGRHNILNALAVIATADIIGADLDAVVLALSKFTGADRRFQVKAKINDITIIDDYAHHPTEIAATLRGARQFFPKNRIIAVFQPHQYSRTRLLLNEFSQSFTDADLVFVPEIFAVRDTAADIVSVSSRDLVQLIMKGGQKAEYFTDFDSCLSELIKTVKPGDVVITIGAGPVYKVGEKLSTSFPLS
jgi:UDP-N-acetylmuramate--alanine ligase